jgi:hypothetical protein
VHGVNDRVIPQQDLERELRSPLQEPAQQLAELDRRPVGRPLRALEPGAAVQLPAEDHHGALCREQRGAQRFEVARGVDENRGTCNISTPPTGVALDQQPVSRARLLLLECSRSATPP